MSDESPTAFYDALAPLYHLNYADWRTSVDRQGSALESLLRSHDVAPGSSVLDLACGIGTQALGLAARGYSVTASDISSEAITRARAEAAQRGLAIDFSVGDMRMADRRFDRPFDAVIACDNAIPHLLDDDEILLAFRAFHTLTRPGGVCLISVRDYEAESREPLQVRTPMVHERDGGREVLFQVWKFQGDRYELSIYVVEERRPDPPRVHVMRTRYYAVSTDTLLALMTKAGFEQATRLDDVFFQPVLVGRRGPGAWPA